MCLLDPEGGAEDSTPLAGTTSILSVSGGAAVSTQAAGKNAVLHPNKAVGTPSQLNCPTDCNDGNPCTTDMCDLNTGNCVNTPMDCEDGDPCTLDQCVPQKACVVPDNGHGTADLPPEPCAYLSPNDLHEIINGLPPGTTIGVSAVHAGFFNMQRFPGGPLDGEVETFDSSLGLTLAGTGMLAGYNRVVSVPVSSETHVGPRIAGAPVQSFDTDMFRLSGQITGDPDFDLLRITAGTDFGMPSPGHTTLTLQLTGTWVVDSFFDITYRIDFVGAPGGPLAGMSGSTTATIRMATGGGVCQHVPVSCDDGDACTLDKCNPQGSSCVAKDDGSGTVTLPPAGCGYVSPADVHKIVKGLPPGTTIELAAVHRDFFCPTAAGGSPVCSFAPPVPGVDCTEPGGSLDGEKECAGSTLALSLTGTGMLAGYSRALAVPIDFETHTAPRVPGDPVQSFNTDMFRLAGQILGDPDFDLLRITAGTDFGMPSPGHTTLTRQPAGTWVVDSFFDITYRIDFVGRPGGPLGGMSGSTTATIRMATGSGVCEYTPLSCDDGNACTLDTCNPATGACEHVALNCDDGDPCTLDRCNPDTGGCEHQMVCEVDSFPNSLGQIDLRYPPNAATPHLVGLSGPTTVVVNLPAIADTNGNGREEVPTEMTQLQLSGVDATFGPIVVRRRNPGVHPMRRTLGGIEETVNYTPGVLDLPPFVGSPAGLTAQSFFDVFFEVELVDLGLVLHNHVPKHLSGTIYHKPPAPGDTYASPDFIDLYDDNETLVARAGPGYHIPNPPPQPPEIDIFSGSRARVDIRVPAGSPQPHLVSLSGPTSVSVALAALADPDNNGREQVPTEMLQLSLNGVDPLFGPVRVRLRDSGLEPFQRSRGQIEETANLISGTLDLPPFNPAGPAADSFFDVFVEVELPALGMVLHTHQPKRMSGLIRYKPPTWGDWYESPEFIPLYDANDNLVAELAPNLHVPNPCDNSGQCNDNNPCTDDTCDPATGRCLYTNNDANACSDGDNCTVDRCANGACAGVPVSCDDRDPCTVDTCDPATGTCTNSPVSCDDGNACTLDRCNPATGACEHVAVNCDDGNPCTLDRCNPVTGGCSSRLLDGDEDGVCNATDQCPHSILTPTVVIGTCDSGVGNYLFPDGCNFGDLIAECLAGARNHGQFVSCVAHLADGWKRAGRITGRDGSRIVSCAAQQQGTSRRRSR